MENKKETVKIDVNTFKSQVEEGMKLDELATYYNLPKSQIKKVLQKLNLQIRKFHKPAFELVGLEITEEEIQDELPQTQQQEEGNFDINPVAPHWS